ncbi:LacI family DNA-binding transcriptional regulator [Actinopolymorpha sp. B9G3]|uniref:LacI family DNA-binding transcriptional regulator n=1 Tax=Actinopolymorpha sp. B9G3 TaxID=3158970 RepID=UPI0032D937B4
MSGPRASRPTVRTVAEAAGVSVASVSRVLNGLTTNEETIRRVQAAVAEVGYVPNSAAKSLKTRHSGQVAFAMEDIGNAAYLAMVRAIQPLLREAGYRLLLHSTDADVQDEIEVLRSLGQRYVDGLILCPLRVTEQHVEELGRATAPVVVIGQLPQGCPVDNVRVDSRPGVARAIEHLVEGGRERIALIDGPADTVPGRSRYLGYLDGLKAAGLEERQELVAFTDFAVDAGAKATQHLLTEGAPDAIFAANDVLAMGALQTLRQQGVSVPDDIAVVGMDDTELAATAWPPLSSVSLGARERGQLAAELLLKRLEDPGRPPEWIDVEPRLVVRASSAPVGTP